MATALSATRNLYGNSMGSAPEKCVPPPATSYNYFSDTLHLVDPLTRRNELRRYVNEQVAAMKLGMISQCAALGNVVDKAACLASTAPSPAATMVGDLEAVVLGSRVESEAIASAFGESSPRGKGPWFVQTNLPSPAGPAKAGFLPGLAEGERNQAQHTIGGIAIAFRYGEIGEAYALHGETAVDKRLYGRAFDLGESLNDSNYMELGGQLRSTMCK